MSGSNRNRATIKIHKRYNINYKRIMSGQKVSRRSSTEIDERPGVVEVKIYADDISALRASINAVMRDISSIESSISGADRAR